MLTKVDVETFKLLRNLCAPDKPGMKSYEQLQKIMDDYLCPAPSEVMKRCTFNQAKQEVSESVAEYAIKLKKLSLNCNFINLKMALKDQFVSGIRDEVTRVVLFKNKELTFEAALEEAMARGNATKNAAGSLRILAHKNSKGEMYTLRNKKFDRLWQHNRLRPHQKTICNFTAKREMHNPSRSYNNEREKKCYCCGKPNHRANRCRYRYKTCNVCQRRGHLEAACRSKQSMTSSRPGKPRDRQYDIFRTTTWEKQIRTQRLTHKTNFIPCKRAM
ncbi:hypothetical protein PUN28_016962 [Cardiocondyla obscurior]|uniref:CCHC-type domain-containing protein n=1 Tax=Cardiocondyla obscurior TaxID=286306 RepID=A0AAW2ENZ7_9HYME